MSGSAAPRGRHLPWAPSAPPSPRLSRRVRLSVAWELHDLGYRMQEAAQRVSDGRRPGPTPLYMETLYELTEAAGISAADLLECAEAGGYSYGRGRAR